MEGFYQGKEVALQHETQLRSAGLDAMFDRLKIEPKTAIDHINRCTINTDADELKSSIDKIVRGMAQ